MPSSTPDWSALASQNEKVVDGEATGEASPSVPADQRLADRPGRHAAPARRSLWRSRASRGAAAATAAALAVTGAASVPASASTAASPSWHIVKRVHAGDAGGFTAVTAVGTNGGWAFNGQSKPTAWRRSGTTWTQVPFPGKSGEHVVAAKASSPTNVWAFTGGGNGSRALRWNGTSWAVERSFARQVGGAVVLSRDDVWVFGQPVFPGSGLGSWHFDGHTWTRATSGRGLQGGSGLSASNVWAFGGASVAHWNSHSWSRTSVAGLLPPRNMGLNNPAVTAIYARSASSVWAIGNGNAEDDGGPLVVLHYNGQHWARAAGGIVSGYSVLGQLAPDGHGGLWIPLLGGSGAPSRLAHYSAGHLTVARLPVVNPKINVLAVAAIRGSGQALAAGFTHAVNNLGSRVVAVILRYQS
jgi:hypothetical protein